jgi:hypothetical protein
MVARNALRRTLAMLGGSFASAAVAVLALAAAGSAQAGTIGDPTECFTRVFGAAGRVNDTVNTSPADGPETGNHLYRIDTFDLTDCEYAEIEGLSIVVKNPFDIPGADVDLNASTFAALSGQMESDFPGFDHWTGWSLPPPGQFQLNQGGFHGISVCVFTGASGDSGTPGDPGNLDDCVAGIVPRFPLIDIDGQGMIFSLVVPGGEAGFFCNAPGECDDPLEIAVVAYSDVYGNTLGVYSHPEAVIGYQFIPLVPEPSLLALVGCGFAAFTWRRRARA